MITKHPYALICSLFLFFLLSQPVRAQDDVHPVKARTAMYVEFGGNGDAYSLNFDRILFQEHNFKGALRVGLSTNLFFLKEEKEVYPIIPIEAIGMLGNKEKNFEFGLGYTRRFTDAPDLLQNMYFARLGLRYQKPKGGLLVRVGITPFLSTEINERSPGVAIVPRFGLSIGHSF